MNSFEDVFIFWHFKFTDDVYRTKCKYIWFEVFLIYDISYFILTIFPAVWLLENDMTWRKDYEKKHVAFVDFYHFKAETSPITLAICRLNVLGSILPKWTSINVYGAYLCTVQVHPQQTIRNARVTFSRLLVKWWNAPPV